MLKSRVGKEGRSLKAVKSHRPPAPSDEVQRVMTVEQVRLVADLRIMHAKVDELYQISKVLRIRHNERSVVEHADKAVLAEDIRKVDELYIWFVELKDEAERLRRKRVVNGV